MLSKIYILIRPKKGVCSQQRLEVLLAGKVFDRIREENLFGLKKVQVIDGDIIEDRLGGVEEQESSPSSNTLIS